VTTKFDYADAQNTAVELIDEFGQAGALRRTTSSGDVFNPTQTTTDYPCTFAVLDYAKGLVDGTLIQQSDQMVYLSTAGLSVTPETTDQLVVAGAALTIVNVKPLAPAGTVLMWELQVRR
jgi:hypothetical protein